MHPGNLPTDGTKIVSKYGTRIISSTRYLHEDKIVRLISDMTKISHDGVAIAVAPEDKILIFSEPYDTNETFLVRIDNLVPVV